MHILVGEITLAQVMQQLSSCCYTVESDTEEAGMVRPQEHREAAAEEGTCASVHCSWEGRDEIHQGEDTRASRRQVRDEAYNTRSSGNTEACAKEPRPDSSAGPGA